MTNSSASVDKKPWRYVLLAYSAVVIGTSGLLSALFFLTTGITNLASDDASGAAVQFGMVTGPAISGTVVLICGLIMLRMLWKAQKEMREHAPSPANETTEK